MAKPTTAKIGQQLHDWMRYFFPSTNLGNSPIRENNWLTARDLDHLWLWSYSRDWCQWVAKLVDVQGWCYIPLSEYTADRDHQTESVHEPVEIITATIRQCNEWSIDESVIDASLIRPPSPMETSKLPKPNDDGPAIPGRSVIKMRDPMNAKAN